MTNTNLLASASGLSDRELLTRIGMLAGKERVASVELIAHLAVLDVRPSLYAAQGCGSLFTYCTEMLRLSEDAACNHIVAARTCRHFPVVLDLLASGELTLTSVRMLTPTLATENHEAVLARARGCSRREIEALVAELAPLARPLSCPVHVRQGEPRQAAAASGPSPPRDPKRRSGGHRRSRSHLAPREGGEAEARRAHQASIAGEAGARALYPPRGG